MNRTLKAACVACLPACALAAAVILWTARRDPETDPKHAPKAPRSQTARQLDATLDDNDWDQALILARELAQSDSASDRARAIHAMDWLGVKALTDLAIATLGNDPETARIAENAFWYHIDELDDDNHKARLLKAVLEGGDLETRRRTIEETGFLPPRLAMPILIERVGLEGPELSHALERNLYFLSGGVELNSRAEWEHWFSSHQAELASPPIAP